MLRIINNSESKIRSSLLAKCQQGVVSRARAACKFCFVARTAMSFGDPAAADIVDEGMDNDVADLDAESVLAQELDNLCQSGCQMGDDSQPLLAIPVQKKQNQQQGQRQYMDVHHYADGSEIVCKACLLGKKKARPGETFTERVVERPWPAKRSKLA